MFYYILFFYIFLSTLFFISWQNLLVFIAILANLTLVTLILYIIEPEKKHREFNYQKKAILLHKRATNTVFMFISTVIIIFLLIFFLQTKIFEEAEIQGGLLTPILLTFSITIPAFIYLIFSEKSKNNLIDFISDSIINKLDENELLVELDLLLKELNSATLDNKRNLEMRIFDRGKIIVDEFIKKEFPDLEIYFFKKNFVVLSSIAILEELSRRYIRK